MQLDAADQAGFVTMVMADAEEIEFAEVLASSRAARPRNRATRREMEIEAARSEAQRLLQQPTVMSKLCPALRSASDDLGQVAKTVGTVLFPLALIPGAVVPLSSIVAGALAVIVARAGINTICPKPAKTEN